MGLFKLQCNCQEIFFWNLKISWFKVFVHNFEKYISSFPSFPLSLAFEIWNVNKHNEPKYKIRGSFRIKSTITFFDLIYDRKLIQIFVFSKNVSKYYIWVMVGSNSKSFWKMSPNVYTRCIKKILMMSPMCNSHASATLWCDVTTHCCHQCTWNLYFFCLLPTFES